MKNGFDTSMYFNSSLSLLLRLASPQLIFCSSELYYVQTFISLYICPYRFPNTACELLTSDVTQINDKLASEETLLGKIYGFLESEAPLNPLLASFFSKVMGLLITRKSEMVNILKHPGMTSNAETCQVSLCDVIPVFKCSNSQTFVT